VLWLTTADRATDYPERAQGSNAVDARTGSTENKRVTRTAADGSSLRDGHCNGKKNYKKTLTEKRGKNGFRKMADENRSPGFRVAYYTTCRTRVRSAHHWRQRLWCACVRFRRSLVVRIVFWRETRGTPQTVGFTIKYAKLLRSQYPKIVDYIWSIYNCKIIYLSLQVTMKKKWWYPNMRDVYIVNAQVDWETLQTLISVFKYLY